MYTIYVVNIVTGTANHVAAASKYIITTITRNYIIIK